MIDALYNYRQGDIHAAEFSDEFNKLCIPFEESLTEAQLTTCHKLLDCVGDTAAAENVSEGLIVVQNAKKLLCLDFKYVYVYKNKLFISRHLDNYPCHWYNKNVTMKVVI